MIKIETIIVFPKEMQDNYKTNKLLIENFERIIEKKWCEILWDFTDTKVVETSMLALFSIILEHLNNLGCRSTIRLKNNKKVTYEKSIYELFNLYTVDKRAFFKVRRVGLCNQVETDDLLLKYLKNLNLHEYEKIKIIISELVANIKMHTKNKEGIISSYNKNDHEIIIKLVNIGVSISDNIYDKRGMKFKDEGDCLLWALKKTNSTRQNDESGGLGLYLLRKYIYDLKGRFSIWSGQCYMFFESNCYNEKNENEILYIDKKIVENKFNGNIITLYIPYKVLVQEILKRELRTRIIDLSEDF